jgi:hypothetical protein
MLKCAPGIKTIAIMFALPSERTNSCFSRSFQHACP